MIDDILKNGSTSNTVRIKLRKADTGQGFTGLSTASSGLLIGTVCNNESLSTAYSGSNLQTIAACGTYVAPSANKCRFNEVDSTNHKGIYEIQLADARFAVSNAKNLRISVTGVSNLLDAEYSIRLTATELTDSSAISPFNVDPDHTWHFDSPLQTTAPNTLNEVIGFVGLLSMDFTEPLPNRSSIASVSTATFANIAGTEPIVTSSAVTANKKGVNILIDCTLATAGTYTLIQAVVSTDGQTFPRKGRLTIS